MDIEEGEEHHQDSLLRLMSDYNKEFGTNFEISNYGAYKKDITKRLKKREIDLVIVVQQLLTGMDSKATSTLWVDKHLEYHDLLQAYSRTNRVFEAQKMWGNIVCYRNLKKNTDEAIKLFNNSDNTDIIIQRDYSDYVKLFRKTIDELYEIAATPSDVDKLASEKDKAIFVRIFKKVAQLLLALRTFVDFEFEEGIIGINEQTHEDFKSKYLDIHKESKNTRTPTELTSILEDIDFDIELVQTDGGFVIRGKKISEFNPMFMNYALKYSENRKKIIIKGAGAQHYNIGQESLSKIDVNIPLSEEQQKIADCFSTLDSRIEIQKEKVKNLEEQKKGYMQMIFSQEIRFKDENGEDYPEWEEKKLGEILDHYGGTALEKHVHPQGTHKFISIGNYSKSGKYIDNGQRIRLNNKTKEKLLNKNDLVMILNDKTSAGDIIGATIIIDEDNKYIYNQRSERIVFNSDLSPLFMWFLLNSKKQRTDVFKISQGGTQIYVNFSAVKKLRVMIPSNHEQQRIPNFLSLLDEKNEIEKKILETLQEMKKGFLQKMFV